MKIFIYCIFLLGLYSSCKKETNAVNAKLILNSWRERSEESTFLQRKFVLSQTNTFDENVSFRQAFKFESPNILTLNLEGRDGKVRNVVGTWRIISGDILEITYNNDFVANFTKRYLVSSLTAELLLLSPITN